MASTKDADLREIIIVKFLSKPSIHPADQLQAVNCATMADNWMTPIIQHLRDGVLLEDKSKARQLRFKVAWYILYYEKLYRRGFFASLLKCVDLEEGNYIFFLRYP